MQNPAYVNRALALYNAPPYPYNTLSDIEQVNIGFGKRRHHRGRGKTAKGHCHHCGRGRVVRHHKKR